MKIAKIDILIPLSANKHRQQLAGEMKFLAEECHFDYSLKEDTIELTNMPSRLTNILEQLKVVYKRMKAGNNESK